MDATGSLLCGNEPSGRPAPRFFVGRTSGGVRCWFRHDVNASVRSELRGLCATLPSGTAPIDPAQFERVLARQGPIASIDAGPAFLIEAAEASTAVQITTQNAACLLPLLSAWRGDEVTCEPLFGAVVGDRAVAVCGSVRRTEAADEAGVETVAEFRRQGHGTAVVRAWAAETRRRGKFALYSTAWSNTGSRRLAAGLGLTPFSSDLHIT